MDEDQTELQPLTLGQQLPKIQVSTENLAKQFKLTKDTLPTPVIGWGMPEHHKDLEMTSLKAEVSYSFHILSPLKSLVA